MFAPTAPENAAAIQRMESVLSELSIGSTLGYDKLIKIAKCDVRNGHRWLLQKAIDNCEKNLGCAFECVRTVGIRRLMSSEIPDIGLAALRRARIAARKGKRRIDRANINSMSESDRRRVIGYGAMLGAVALLADGRKASAIAAVADPAKAIPPQNILDMFKTGE